MRVRKFIVIAASYALGYRFIEDIVGGKRFGSFIIVTNEDDMALTVGLEADNTPWVKEPTGTLNDQQKFCYRSLEQRFGSVWSIVKFSEAVKDLRPLR